MKIKYFADTDTAQVEFSQGPVQETVEVNENIYLELDANGGLVSMTIEHAQAHADLSEVSFLRMAG